MKRIVYSVWDELTEPHVSSDEYKQKQLKKYIDILKQRQRDYADICHADYHVFSAGPSKYQDIQFYKLHKLEELAKEYDEILYLDMDVIPNTSKNIFDSFDLSKISYHAKEPPFFPNFHNKTFDQAIGRMSYMSSWVKLLIKKAMLNIDDIDGNDLISNTGVIVTSGEAIKRLEFMDKLEKASECYYEAMEDNFYPQKIVDVWTQNNEVFLSYIVERYDVETNEIGIQWNYILDNKVTEYTSAAYFIHQVNKEFDVGLRL